MQRAQQFAHKTDLNSSYAAGGSSHQHMDGTMEKVALLQIAKISDFIINNLLYLVEI